MSAADLCPQRPWGLHGKGERCPFCRRLLVPGPVPPFRLHPADEREIHVHA